MLLQRLRYGFRRLFDELGNKEDYWHLRLKPELNDNNWTKVYFHDMAGKGIYPGEIVDGIPVFYLNGNNRVVFYTTVLNYALGLLNRYATGEQVGNDLLNITQWLLNEQCEDGSWRYNFVGSDHPLSKNKAAGMTQGLAVSFLIRSMNAGFLSKEVCMQTTKKAIQFMLSDEIVSIHDNKKLIEEFYSPGVSILNGSIFALYGLYDYCMTFGDMKCFHEYINALKILLSQYKLGYWSYYDMHGTITSKFYHQLHIDMMIVLYHLTNESIFREYAEKWQKGLKISFFFILLKAFQKLRHINKMVMSYANKKNE